jgi:hypothetical protein
MHKHDVKFDIPPLDTRKAIQVKVAWKKFQSLAVFIVIRNFEIGLN